MVSVAALVAAFGAVAVPGGIATAAVQCSPDVFDANGDGIEDAVVGVPKEDKGKGKARQADSGAVTIVYGADGTFGDEGSRVLTQETLGGTSEKNDRFGESLAIGDVNDDGCKDLVIGVPGENRNAGRIVVVYGADAGLDVSKRQSISQDTTGVLTAADDNEEFGASLAVQGEGSGAVLWVGVPGENDGNRKGAGMVVSFPAGPSEGVLDPNDSESIRQGDGPVPGNAEEGDRFGERMIADSETLVVGVPKEDGAPGPDSGSVYVFTDTWSAFNQDSTVPIDLPGQAKRNDRFGAAVGLMDSCSGGDTKSVVVGVPGRNVSGSADAGLVVVVDRGAGTALAVDQAALGGSVEPEDQLGLRVAGDGDLLVAAAPYEAVGKAVNAGSVSQARLSCSGGQASVSDSDTFTLNTVDGNARAGDRFGLELAFSWSTPNDAGGPELLIGSPLKGDGSAIDGGRVTVLSEKVSGLFVPDEGSLFGQSELAGKQERGDQFGASIAVNAG